MEYKKLGDIATYINGYAFKPEQRGSEGLPIIRIQDLTGNAYDLGHYNGDYPKKIELNDGDVLISWSASLGVYLWNRGKALLNQHIFKVVFDKVEIDKFYFMYAVEYNLDKMSLKTHGATMKHITKKDFDNVVIPYPDLDYQKDISYRLTSLKRIIEKYQEQLDLLDELIKARFVEMFSDNHYELIRLADVCTKITDGTHKTPNYLSEGITFISAKNIVKNKLDFSDVKYISEDEYQEIQKRCQTEFNDILLSKSGSLGTPVIVKTDKKLGLFESLAVLKYDRLKLVPEFLCEQLKNEEIQRQFKVGVKGVAIKHLHLGVIGNVKIIVPPLELQNQFASFVEEIDKSRSRIQKSLEASQELFDSLMQEYFG
nr:restriction endonuclease subunit S [Catenibacterium mitsuokai]